MGCIYEDCFTGLCGLVGDGDKCDGLGIDNEGVCVVSEDPDPALICYNYESDSQCPECGIDLNVDDCDCD